MPFSVADLEGVRAGSTPSPLDDGLTPSLSNAKFWSFCCKAWYSEYSKWLPPVAFWHLSSAPNSFSAGVLLRPHWESLQRSPRPCSWGLTFEGKVEGERKGREEGKRKEGNRRDRPSPIRKFLNPPLPLYLFSSCFSFSTVKIQLTL